MKTLEPANLVEVKKNVTNWNEKISSSTSTAKEIAKLLYDVRYIEIFRDDFDSFDNPSPRSCLKMICFLSKKNKSKS